MIYYSLEKDGLFVQGIETNDKYCPSSKAPTMGRRHDTSEFKCIFGETETWFERLTLKNYIMVLTEQIRWGDLTPTNFKINVKTPEE